MIGVSASTKIEQQMLIVSDINQLVVQYGRFTAEHGAPVPSSCLVLLDRTQRQMFLSREC